eukprot:360479-Chlamydomonas_euryale.AAC.8
MCAQQVSGEEVKEEGGVLTPQACHVRAASEWCGNASRVSGFRSTAVFGTGCGFCTPALHMCRHVEAVECAVIRVKAVFYPGKRSPSTSKMLPHGTCRCCCNVACPLGT